MFHNSHRFLNTSMAVLVVLSLLLGFVSPVFAEGEMPEVVPPAVTPGSVGEDSPQNLVQALSDGGAVLTDAGMLVPLASQTALEVLCDPDPWFYGALCTGGVCRGLLPGEDGFVTIQGALDSWWEKKGKGYIYLEGIYEQAETLTINDATSFSTLKGIVWDGTSGTPQLNGNLTVSNLPGGFLLQGFTIDGEVTFTNNKGLIMLQNMTLDQKFTDGYGLKIENHIGPVTLNQVRVANARNFGVYIDNVYPAGAASGAVTVNNLNILNTGADSGVTSPWYGGLYIRSNSPVTINGLFIKDTESGGALIHSGAGAVTIKNGYVGFSHIFDAGSTPYDGFGLRILGDAAKVGTITLDNLRLYNNQGDGLNITAASTVKINNVFSSGNNEEFGIHIGDTVYGYAATSLTITSSQFNWNKSGNSVVIKGPVSITNTEFSGNWGDEAGDEATGLYLNNSTAGGAAVVLIGVSANNNYLDGLHIITSGNATLTTIQAFHNGATGAEINALAGLGNVTLTNSIFNDNGGDGLSIVAQKNITLKLVEASNNVEFGAKLNNSLGTGNVTLQGTGTSGNNFHKNGTFGLSIHSRGVVSITNISTDGNFDDGVAIDTTSGRGGVSILAASPYWLNAFTFSRNGNGLTIFSLGNIKLVNVAAWQNARTGVELDNCRHNGGCTGFGSVTISSLGTSTVNSFNDNGSRGLVVHSFGNISLNNVEASRNEDIGIHLYNFETNSLGKASVGNISIKNLTWRDVSENRKGGINVVSNGNILLNGVSVNNNFSYGASLNIIGSIARTITVSNSSFNDTVNGKGLNIYNSGKVSLSSVSARGNDVVEEYIGLGESVKEKISGNNRGQPDRWTYSEGNEDQVIAGWIDSSDFTPLLTVWDATDEVFVTYDWSDGYFWFDTVAYHEYLFFIAGEEAEYTGRYTFEMYEYIDKGDGTPVDLGKTFANDGLGGTGIYVNNDSGIASVTFTSPATYRAEVNDNSGDGLFVRSNGAVTVNNLNAYGNGNMGVNITTNAGSAVIPATVALSGLETNWNGGHGVGVQALGSILYSSSASGGNGYYAAYLDNCRPDGSGGCEATVVKPVTLTKLNFDNNAYGPAVVFSFGNITAGGIKSFYNNGSGLALFNNFTDSTGTITLLGTQGQNIFESNSLAGMRIYSNGNVTLSNFVVRNNGSKYIDDADDPEALSAGIYISSSMGKIMLSSGTVEANVHNGILIDSYNSVSMSKMTVFMNGWNWEHFNDKSGIEIKAHGVSPVSITSSLIFGNAKHGLAIFEGVGNPILTGTVIFGNDLDNDGDEDWKVYSH